MGRRISVTYFDDNHVYIDRMYDASSDLQEAFNQLMVDITDKEDELN